MSMQLTVQQCERNSLQPANKRVEQSDLLRSTDGRVGNGWVLYGFQLQKQKDEGLFGYYSCGLLGTGIWIGGLINQFKYSRDVEPTRLDFKDSGAVFAGPFVLYFFYGLLDAMFQRMIYWVIGALANDSEILSRYTGFYRGKQSAGAAIAWQVYTNKVPFLNQLIANWTMTTISYPLLNLLVSLAVKDDNTIEQVVPKDASTSRVNMTSNAADDTI